MEINSIIINSNNVELDTFIETLNNSNEFQINYKIIPDYSKGLKLIDENKFDVIFLSLYCEKATKYISQINKKAYDIPIIIILENEDKNNALYTLQNGATDYLINKEVSVDLLERSLRYSINIKKTENNISSFDTTFSRFADSIREGFAQTNLNGKILFFNEAFKNMLGYKKDEIYKLTYEEITPKKWHEYEKKILEQQVFKKGYSKIYEKEYISKNGNILPVELRTYLLKNEDGEPEGMWAFIKDISERKKSELEREALIKDLEEALEKSDEAGRLKSEFLTIISHELRTPLHGILGYASLLIDDEYANEEIKESALYIYESGERLMRILDDLIEISMIEAGKLNITYKKVDINKIVEDIYILFKDQFSKKGINFVKSLNDIDFIISDEIRLRQILLNLIGNAIKFTKEGKIEVELCIKNDNYLFVVKDTGIGIGENEKSIIFDMFVQVENAASRKHEGIGLGLTICKKLIQMLDGDIWVKSKIGIGSEFHFIIPVVKNLNEEYIESKVEYKVTKKSNNILFAEDDESSFKLIEKAINKLKDYNAVGFDNGKDLLEEFKNNGNYDIIILDINMPLLDGISTLKEIRKINKVIPVIALTAYGEHGKVNKYLEMGFSDYLNKPVKLEIIRSTIKRYLPLEN